MDEISNIQTLKSVKIRYLTEKGLINISKNCQQLETFSIGRFISKTSDQKPLYQAFDTFFEERRHTLKKFSIIYFKETISNWFRNIHGSQNLEELVIKVRFLDRLDCESISQLRGLKKLTITLTYVSYLESIIQKIDVANLKNLILVGNGDKEGKLFDTVSKKHFPALERLYIQSSGYSDRSVQELVGNCPNLKSAQLYVLAHKLNFDKSCSKSISIHTLINNSIKNNLYTRVGNSKL